MRNVSPADERRPQGLRAHIHTFTMRAFSDSSAKKFAHCGPSRSSSAKKSAHCGPSRSSSAKKLARHTPTNATPARKLSQHTPTSTTPDTKLARYSRKHPIWALFRVQGECIHACGSNRPSRRIPLASSAAVEAQHPAPTSTPPNPTTVDESGGHRRDRDERKYTHA